MGVQEGPFRYRVPLVTWEGGVTGGALLSMDFVWDKTCELFVRLEGARRRLFAEGMQAMLQRPEC